MSPYLHAYLTPSSSAVKFAIKGTLAMFLALYIALWADLERPYWALISAAFLQIRPMSGMVIEKGLCQLAGTLVGAIAGVIIMALFAQAAVPALSSLTLWVILCVYGSALTRSNLSYGCIMAAVTALLIVVIASGDPGSVFDIAVSRLTELGLGAICATLVSALLWPTRVAQHLAQQADSVVNHAFAHATQRLEASDDDEGLQRSLTASLGPLMTLEVDSQAARYEGPAGPGRVRATHLLTQRTLRLCANVAALGQLLREQSEHLHVDIQRLATETAVSFRQAEKAEGVTRAREILQQQRHATYQVGTETLTPLSMRVLLGLREALGHAMIMLDAREAITSPERRRLRNPPLSWHRDHLVAAVNAGRAGVVFMLMATFWLATGWDNGPIAMMLATMFSAFFASRDNPASISVMFFKGMLLAIPSAFLFGHVLLAQASGFVMLAMLFGVPLFLGLLGAGHPATMGYSLAFTIFNILLTMPGNNMDFGIDSFLNRTLAVIIGVSVVTCSFRLMPELGSRVLRQRLINATSRDLKQLMHRPLHEADSRFSGRMADRLLHLARHDETLPEQQRYLFSLGLTGLDLGHACLRLRQRLDDAISFDAQRAHRHMLAILAQAYADSARGHPPQGIAAAGRALQAAVMQNAEISHQHWALLEGLIERLELMLQRQARLMASAP